jgi:CHAD domain-containing protein
MSRKPAPKPDDPEQSKRFIEIAKEVGADQDSEVLEQALKTARKKSPSKDQMT